MPDISFVNPQINNIKDQEISIQASLSGFSFYIRSSSEKTCLHFKHLAFKHMMLTDELFRTIEQLVDCTAHLDKRFKVADITYLHQGSTLIPEAYFDPAHLKSYFEFNQNLAELDEIHYSYIEEVEAYNVFSFPSYVSNILYPKGEKCMFNHQATRLIKLAYKFHSNNSDKPCVVLGLNKGFFDMVVFEDGKLLLSNSYLYTNTMDFIYFFLYTMKQLKIDPESISTFVLGEVLENSSFVSEIKQQIKHISVPKLSVGPICPNMSEEQIVRFYNLFME